VIGIALLLGALGTALVLALALAWALRRLLGQFGPSRSPASRAERLLKSVPAGLAAVLAFVAAASVSVDASYEIGGGIVLVLVAAGVAAAIASVALAGRGPLSQAPYLAGSVAIACALLLLASSPLAFARSVCACTTPAVPYVPPTLAGMDATTWAMISAVGTPVLLLVALMRRS
jgi:hypothetical protein